ncbi:non-ribosomal peptide synthetase, partial [Reyranella sp. CPCC 100927]|uniref:non-ribosomal peptide synthetase n=1 Tax=Reyranella sp. CPCC 100927 TaxID=2599616 RepID=UPI0011B5EBBA
MTPETGKRRRRVPTKWTSRIISGDAVGTIEPPDWFVESYKTFRHHVTDPEYPCFFGTQAERRGEMFYAFASTGDLTHLPSTMAKFLALSAAREHEKNNFALFFEPQSPAFDHDDARSFFWRTLQHLHDHDDHTAPDATAPDPSDPMWEFTFGGVQMFVVGCSPSYRRRHSRNLGPGLILLFQPRSVFIDAITQHAIGPEVRERIRDRLVRWDEVSPHGSLGVYGDSDNREWKQYFLPDDESAGLEKCPFLQRRGRTAEVSRAEGAVTHGERANLKKPADLLEALRRHVELQPERPAVRFLRDGESDEAVLTYGDLDRQARQLAVDLRRHADAGARALLLLPNGLDYVVAFFACLHAGIIAVPAYPAETAHAHHFDRLRSMLRDCTPRLLLTDAVHAPLLDNFAADDLPVDHLRLIIERDSATRSVDASIDRGPGCDIAFLQYTSGSTTAPKGVVVGHDNLVANLDVIRHAFAIGRSDVVVTWLPLYHDMGLIGALLTPLFAGATVVLMTSEHFLASPARWLRAISRHRGTIGVAPDFAYQLCVDRCRDSQTEGLDLSAWRLAGCGAEPIRPTTMRAFMERFSRLGLRPGALAPCYGLAEATLMVSADCDGTGARVQHFAADGLARGLARHDESGTGLIDCGRPQENHSIRIVDPASLEECSAGQIGEIWFAGPSVARGYWSNTRATKETFQAVLPNVPGQRFLRTGDVGFLHGGRLFVSGRLKDLIIIRGQNVYPQDIEWTIAEQVEDIRKGRIAAFAVSVDGREGIGVAMEVSRGRLRTMRIDAIFRAVNAAVSEVYQEPVSVILLLKGGDLPRTSSGKLRRGACLTGWQDGTLGPIAVHQRGDELAASAAVPVAAPRTDTEILVSQIWQEAFGRPSIGVDRDFFELGGQSLTAAQILARIGETFRVDLPLQFVFEARTIAAQAQRLAQRKKGDRHRAPPRPRADGPQDKRFALTHAQERLWFEWRLAPESAAYTVAGALHLVGALDVAALRAALAAVVGRHEALRARFHETDGVACQVIDDAPVFAWRDVDVQTWSEADHEQQVAVHLRRLAAEPFDLEHGPLLRATLLRGQDRAHILLLAVHHIACDGWSIAILLRELSAFYEALHLGTDADLPSLELGLADYVRWQRDEQSDEDLALQRTYWQAQLAGASRSLELPTDRPRLPGERYAGETLRFDLPPELQAALKDLALKEGVTPFMVVLAAFKALLAQYCGQTDIVVGTPVSTRSWSSIEGLIGFFVNTLALRSDLSGDPTVRELLQHVKQTTLEGIAHQDVPFDQVVADLQLDRDRSLHPVFQVLFAWQTLPLAHWELPDLHARWVDVDTGTAKFDLSLSIVETPSGWRGAFEYAAALFDSRTIGQLREHFLTVLRAFAAEPEGRLSSLRLLGNTEEQAILAAGTGAADPATPDRGVHELVAEQARRTPQAVALVHAGASLTYGELEQRADRRAHHLIRSGVGDGMIVGLCVERSLDLVINLLAILKAGATCLPLDRGYPQERLAFMLMDARPPVVIVDSAAQPVLPIASGTRTILVDAEAWDGETGATGLAPCRPDSLAYVLYTSGSTGQPKAIAMPHRALSNLVSWHLARHHDPLSRRVAQLTPISFDVSFQEIFTALVGGKTLCLADHEARLDRKLLLDFVLKHEIHEVFAPQVLLDQLADEAAARDATELPLRHVFQAGEALRLSPNIVSLFGQRSAAVLHNHYGPTETHVATATTLPPSQGDHTVSVGAPIANARAYVLDEALRIVPVGVAGELYLGGACLAQGYLNRPGLTADRFLPDPFGVGGRLYRTGDRARWRRNGDLELLGRLDDQVKIRGFRVELGDVEAAVRACTGVREAVVTVADAGVAGRLIAHLTIDSSVDVTATTLRRELGGKLPAFMLPAAFVVLEALPRLPNGKVDRRSLPAPIVASDVEHVAARTATEAALCEIWADVLGVPKVGTRDDFFLLGGHSLLAVRIVSRLRQKLGRDVPLRTVFAHPVLADLATEVDRAASTTERAIQPRASKADRIPLSPAQESLWFLWKLEPHSAAYNLPGLVRLKGSLDVNALRGALRALVERHESLRTRFAEADGVAFQVVSDEPAYGWSEVDLRELEPAVREALLQERVHVMGTAPFDLEADPLLRVEWVRLTDAEHVLLVTMHHIVADGWSIGICLRELEVLYGAAREGLAAALPALPIQYADYALWRRESLAGDAMATQLAYWRQRLGDEHPVMELPADRRRGAGRDAVGGRISRHVPADVAAALGRSARTRGTTLFVTLLAALNVLLHRYGGQTDLRVGIPVSGRQRLETEGLIGFFVNMLVIRTELTGSTRVEALLEQVRTHVLEAQAHQDLPFARLVEALQAERSLSRTPLFQVTFNLEQEQGQPFAGLPGLEAGAMEAGSVPAPFDLMVSVKEGHDGLHVSFTYARDLFGEATIERLCGHYVSVLEGLSSGLEQRVGEIALSEVSAPSRALVRYGFEPVTRSITAQASARAEAEAVSCGDDRLSYGGLEAWSNRIGRRLKTLGVGREVRV